MEHGPAEMSRAVRCFWDERQRAHQPQAEFFNGALNPAAEHGGRTDAILGAIGPTQAPADQGMAPILRVHSADYCEFLRTAHDAWRDAGRSGRILRSSGAALDHPVHPGLPETAYLKAMTLQLD